MADEQPPVTTPPGVPPGYDALREARRLLRSIRAGTLATLAADGYPFATLVNVATAMDGAPILLMSGLSAHTKNLLRDQRASLLLPQGGKGDPLAHARLTLVGDAVCVSDPAQRSGLRARFLSRHPKSALYADFGDFSFWRLEMARAHLNGGFARAADFDGAQIRTDVSGADELADIEAGALEHMNRDHAAAVRLYATQLLRQKEGRWKATGIDPGGLDLALGDSTARLEFPEPVRSGEALRRVLAALAAAARALNEQNAATQHKTA